MITMIPVVSTEDLTTTVTLPVLIPLLNLILSVAALVSWGIVIRRALRAPFWEDGNSARLFFSAFFTLLVIIVAGAISQSGLLPTAVWVVIGTGGRLIVAMLGIVMAADRDLIRAAGE